MRSGRKPRKWKAKPVLLNLPIDLVEALTKASKRKNMSRTAYIINACKEYVERDLKQETNPEEKDPDD